MSLTCKLDKSDRKKMESFLGNTEGGGVVAKQFFLFQIKAFCTNVPSSFILARTIRYLI